MMNWWASRPRRGMILGIVAVIAVSTGAAGCGDDKGDTGLTATTTTAGTTQTNATTGPATTLSIRCIEFPITGGAKNESAESLITNSDTGKRRIEGTITKAAAVKSKETVPNDAPIGAQRGKPIYFVSINVGGKIITLAHSDVDNSGKPNGGGLWSSLDEVSAQATNFPQNTSYLRAFLNTDGMQESRDCVA
jgi:hypothetical protein